MACGTAMETSDVVDCSSADIYSVGTVHWISFGDYPWWPARVANRCEVGLDCIPDEYDVLVVLFSDFAI